MSENSGASQSPGATPQQVQGPHFLAQISKLARTAQFYWYLSHVFAIFFMALCTIISVFKGNFNYSAIRYYQLSITSIIITYLIVIRQTYRAKPITFLFSQFFQLVGDDNVQYLLLASMLRFFASRIYGGINATTLQPFTIFALFHSLSYFQSMILPFLSPLSAGTKQKISSGIQSFVKKYNETSLIIASNMELMTAVTYSVQTLISVVTMKILKPSLFAMNLKTVCMCASYVTFCKVRYDQSRYMQTLINSYDMRFNQLIYGSRFIPQSLKGILVQLRSLIISVLGHISLPATHPAQAGN